MNLQRRLSRRLSCACSTAPEVKVYLETCAAQCTSLTSGVHEFQLSSEMLNAKGGFLQGFGVASTAALASLVAEPERYKLFQGDKHEAYYGRTREGWTELVKKIKEINN